MTPAAAVVGLRARPGPGSPGMGCRSGALAVGDVTAQGPRVANVVGVTDQTDLFRTMARALGLPS